MARPSLLAFGQRNGAGCLRRILRIHQALIDLNPIDRRVTAPDLARQLECSTRTIKRDIAFLRDELKAPIVWDEKEGTYSYSQSFDLLTGLRLNADEILTLTIASQTFAAWSGNPLGRILHGALRKFALVAGDSVSLPVGEIAGLLSCSTDIPEAEHQHFLPLLHHIQQHREILLGYHKIGAARAETRRVQPLHLAYLDHSWVLVAHDLRRNGWRHFLLRRIESIRATGNRFELPPRDHIARHLSGSLGRFAGNQDYLVRVAFSPEAARYLREAPWHHSQTLHDLPDGGAEATFRLNNLHDIRRHILSCGHHARVLEPPELIDHIRAELAAAARHYTPAGSGG